MLQATFGYLKENIKLIASGEFSKVITACSKAVILFPTGSEKFCFITTSRRALGLPSGDSFLGDK
jgi:hypothetical protein